MMPTKLECPVSGPRSDVLSLLCLCLCFAVAAGCKGKSESADKDQARAIATATSSPQPAAAKPAEPPSSDLAGRVQAFQQLHVQLTLPPDVEGRVQDITDDVNKGPDLTLLLHFKKLDFTYSDVHGTHNFDQQLSCHVGKADDAKPPQLGGAKLHEEDANGWAMIWVDKSAEGAVSYTVACYRAAAKIACSSALTSERRDATGKLVAPADPAPLEAGANQMISVCKTVRPL
jgi:hypothetical protein